MPGHPPAPIHTAPQHPTDVQTHTRSRLVSLSGALRAAYGMTLTRVTHVGSASHTYDVRADLDDDRTVFVRIHHGLTEVSHTRDTIDLIRRAVNAGIPGAQPIPDHDGALINTRYDRALTVWNWIDATPRQPWTATHARTAGAALARLHHALNNSPPPISLRAQPPAYQQTTAEELHRSLDALQQRLETLSAPSFGHDPADLDRITRRRQHLHLLPDLLHPRPAPLTRVMHGAYRPEHLLFTTGREGTLAGIVGYQPANGDLAGEVARAAFDPDTIATTPQWPAVAAAFLTAYRQANGPVTAEHLACCHRLALADYLADTSDWQRLYLGPYPVNTSVIHQRNAHRDTAITQLIEHWDQVDDMIASTADA